MVPRVTNGTNNNQWYKLYHFLPMVPIKDPVSFGIVSVGFWLGKEKVYKYSEFLLVSMKPMVPKITNGNQ